jgi:hypothetical protein
MTWCFVATLSCISSLYAARIFECRPTDQFVHALSAHSSYSRLLFLCQVLGKRTQYLATWSPHIQQLILVAAASLQNPTTLLHNGSTLQQTHLPFPTTHIRPSRYARVTPTNVRATILTAPISHHPTNPTHHRPRSFCWQQLALYPKCNNYGPQGDICTTCHNLCYYYGTTCWTQTQYHS